MQEVAQQSVSACSYEFRVGEVVFLPHELDALLAHVKQQSGRTVEVRLCRGDHFSMGVPLDEAVYFFDRVSHDEDVVLAFAHFACM